MTLIRASLSFLILCRSTNAPADRYGRQRAYIIIAIILTGASVGEISALKWHNLDSKKYTITIHHSYNSDIKELGPTKNTASYRIIRINTKLIDLLREIKIDNKDGYIFQEAATGLPPANRTINSKLQVIMRHVGLDKADFCYS